MITCREASEILHAYVERELPAPMVVDFDRHLAVCPACVRFLAQYRQAIQLGKLFGHLPEGARAAAPELVKAILSLRDAN